MGVAITWRPLTKGCSVGGTSADVEVFRRVFGEPPYRLCRRDHGDTLRVLAREHPGENHPWEELIMALDAADEIEVYLQW